MAKVVTLACTALPANTGTSPTRPALAARISAACTAGAFGGGWLAASNAGANSSLGVNFKLGGDGGYGAGGGSTGSGGFTDDQTKPYTFNIQPFVADKNVVGVTSNPTIFASALATVGAREFGMVDDASVIDADL